MDGTEDAGVETAGARLRAAREAKGLTLDAVAAETRIPTRHLASLEASDWASLPAPTYSLGFAKNYAAVVGLDRTEIADQLRAEMGGTRAVYTESEVFQPADPKRAMPKWLIIGAIVALLVAFGLLKWLNNRQLSPDAGPVAQAEVTPRAAGAAAPAITAAPATGPVSITATHAPVWIRVKSNGQTLRMGNLAPGERFDLPATATKATLDAGRPEGLRVTVGGRAIPQIGKAGRPISNVSLLPADLARSGERDAAATATPATPAKPL